MGRRWARVAGLLILAVTPPGARAAQDRGFSLSVVVDGAPIPEFRGRGTLYVEALRGRPYALRITNPLSCRVAVALSVDGLNTIDAKHTDAGSAGKWVLDPHETVTIPGWQVSGEAAREFFFTGERGSYGAMLGKTEDLGVIEAVFFRELAPPSAFKPEAQLSAPAAPGERRDAASAPVRPQPSGGVSSRAEALSDDFAATGMGRRDRHEVTRIDLELEREPAARVRIRYEFRPQLVRLGILPREIEPLDRREAARGFDSYCPEPR